VNDREIVMRASAGNNATKCLCSHFLTSTFSRSIGCNQWPHFQGVPFGVDLCCWVCGERTHQAI